MSGVIGGVIGALETLASIAGDVPVVLGGVPLYGVEVPSLLRVAGEQNLLVTTLPGGGRVIQAMGASPASLTMAGTFLGAAAFDRASIFDRMRIAGAPVTYSVAQLALTVVVRSFSYDYQQRGAVLPYEIVLEVLPSADPEAADSTATQQDLVNSDVIEANAALVSTITTALIYA